MLSFTKKENSFLKKINTPAKVQDFLNSIPFNFEKSGVDTIRSPIKTLRQKKAHCFEGALLGAYILSLHGFPPLILYLKTTKDDYDHVIAPFQKNGLWGALSKTNHAVLRYREPIYKNIRELCLSYFHEYFLHNGKKTLREYTRPLDLRKVKKNWFIAEEDLWEIDIALNKIKHFEIAPKKIVSKSRKADKIEIETSKITEFQKWPRKKI
jgi:hypothetical protein